MKHSKLGFFRHLLCAAVTLLFTLVVAYPAIAQDNAKTPIPGPEHKRLGFLVGTWQIDRTMKKNQYQPAEEKRACAITGEWFDGNFWVLYRFKETLPTGLFTELVIVGYDTETKTYSWTSFTSTGHRILFTGTVAGNTWIFVSEAKKEGGKSFQLRGTIVEESPTLTTSKWEFSEDGGPWTLFSEERWTKM